MKTNAHSTKEKQPKVTKYNNLHMLFRKAPNQHLLAAQALKPDETKLCVICLQFILMVLSMEVKKKT